MTPPPIPPHQQHQTPLLAPKTLADDLTPRVIARLAPATQLQLIRDAVVAEDTQLLKNARAAGVFELPIPGRVDPRDLLVHYHALEYAMVGAWGALLTRSAEYFGGTDPVSGIDYTNAVVVQVQEFDTPRAPVSVPISRNL